VAGWYAGLTVLALAFAYRGRGLGRLPGAVIIAGYVAFVAALLISVTQAGVRPAVAVFPAAAVMAAGAVLLTCPARRRPPGRTAGAGLAGGWCRGLTDPRLERRAHVAAERSAVLRDRGL
jgi:hypothetical protein